jgi:spore coat protein U-like protein
MVADPSAQAPVFRAPDHRVLFHENKDHTMNTNTLRFAVVAALLVSPAAFAVESTTTFGVSATVEAACSVTATPLAFGSFSAFAGVTDSTSTVSVTCSNTTPYDVGLDAGVGVGADTTNRLLTHDDTTSTLAYALYSNPGRSVNWGDEVATDTVAGTGDGTTQQHTVFGRIANPTLAKVGAFADTITVTVTY